VGELRDKYMPKLRRSGEIMGTEPQNGDFFVLEWSGGLEARA
jgi:hypothetical protein